MRFIYILVLQMVSGVLSPLFQRKDADTQSRSLVGESVLGLRRFCSAGFQTCCVADFQIGRALKISSRVGLQGRLQVRKPAIQQARRPALLLFTAMPRYAPASLRFKYFRASMSIHRTVESPIKIT